MRAPHVLLCLGTALHIAVSCSPPDFRFEKPREGTCSDQENNGPETDEDCGGGECAKCLVGQRCRVASDCVNASCVDQTCQPVECTNNVKDPGETGTDCGGGNCPKCRYGQPCLVASDCSGNLCVVQECVPTSCDNGSFDPSDGETDEDCGGVTCAPCRNGKDCGQSGDCIDGYCPDGTCRPKHCINSVLNEAEGEEAVDCGGPCLPCAAPDPCMDSTKGDGESGTDCGGETACMRCPNNEDCATGADCASGYCDEELLTCQDDPCPDTSGPCGGQGGAGGAPPVGMGGASGGSEPPLGGVAGEGGSPPETGGNGGTSGEGGGASGGMPAGGTGGTTAGGGSGGAGGSTGGSVPTGPLARCETGCARLRVPLAAADHRANFMIRLPNAVDFSTAKVTYRVYVEAGTGGEVKGYVQHSGDPDFVQLFQTPGVPIADITGWQSITFDVGAHPTTTFTKNNVARVGFQIIGANATSFTNPTVISIDSVTVTGVAAGPWNFDSAGTIQTTADHTGPLNIMLLNSADNPVSGSSISWLGP